MNILVLSCGTRNKIIQYFKEAFDGRGLVVATDCSRYAPALYDADRHYIVPKMTEPGYIEIILNICKEEKIAGVLSLIDPELSLLAENAERFKELGVTVIGSPYALCERALNKMEMHNWLFTHGYPCAKSYISFNDFENALANGEISFPVFVKPVCGSASISIQKVNDMDTLRNQYKHNDNLMIQEFLDGQEIGADCYIDLLSGEVISIFTKEKLVMRAGETDKAVSFKDERLLGFLAGFIEESGWRGTIDIDVFKADGNYLISEVNPRFGGGYPHARECGCDFMTYIFNNLSGIRNSPNVGEYETGVAMMKYNEIKILR